MNKQLNIIEYSQLSGKPLLPVLLNLGTIMAEGVIFKILLTLQVNNDVILVCDNF
jgi:hypothetical protein